MSIHSQRAIEDAQRYGSAILKFISENDLGITRSHQSGFYLPKEVWRLFTPQAPQHDVNYDHNVTVIWPDGLETYSCVKWYGRGTRFEYRLTKFGRDFPWRQPEFVGSVLVIIPERLDRFHAYILDTDEEIEEIQTALGIELFKSWAVYPDRGLDDGFDEDNCINRLFRNWVLTLREMPNVSVFSEFSRATLANCIPGFQARISDERFLLSLEKEFHLYKLAERKFFQSQAQRLFRDIDDFLTTANSILQSRKSRAGRSFENQISAIFRENDIRFASQPIVDDTRPDIIIPSIQSYYDETFPIERKFVIGLKRTCKDRWRQVLNEAPKIPIKHIITIQEGISITQLNEMERSGIKLVVPQSLHRLYPRESSPIISGLDDFIQMIRRSQVE